MKDLILVASLCCLNVCCYATPQISVTSQQDTYNVDNSGSVSKGASKSKISNCVMIKECETNAPSIQYQPKMNYMILR